MVAIRAGDGQPSGDGTASGTEVTLPALGESVTEGTVSRWLKQVGDSVEADEPLLEVSTDKVDTEIPSPTSGTVLEIRVQEDETVGVGEVLAVIGEAGAAAPSPAEPEPEPAAEPEPEARAGAGTGGADGRADPPSPRRPHRRPGRIPSPSSTDRAARRPRPPRWWPATPTAGT